MTNLQAQEDCQNKINKYIKARTSISSCASFHAIFSKALNKGMVNHLEVAEPMFPCQGFSQSCDSLDGFYL